MAVIDKSRAPFTYSGSWDLNDYDGGKKYYARFLTSGTLTPKRSFTCDAFLVGAGGRGGDMGGGNYSAGGGGGGGRTNTVRQITCTNSISVTVGASSSAQTKFGTYIAYGGSAGNSGTTIGGSGGSGGSGGGGGGCWSTNSGNYWGRGGKGGFDGSNGTRGESYENGGGSIASGGTGQGSTTLAFGGDVTPFSSMRFAGGGGGGGYSNYGLGHDGGGSGGWWTHNGNAGTANTGGGGGGSCSTGGAGGSGIVIIRGILNVPPTLTGTNENLGEHTDPLTYTYTASDADPGQTLTISETVTAGGLTLPLRSYTAQSGDEQTADLAAIWLQIPGGTATLTIRADDGNGGTATRTLTFTRVVERMAAYRLIPTDGPVSKCFLSFFPSERPAGNELSCQVCNNPQADEPVWEEISGKLNTYVHTFASVPEEASGLAFRFWVTRGDAQAELRQITVRYA